MPACANFTAQARPIPVADPVTKATRPPSFDIEFSKVVLMEGKGALDHRQPLVPPHPGRVGLALQSHTSHQTSEKNQSGGSVRCRRETSLGGHPSPQAILYDR